MLDSDLDSFVHVFMWFLVALALTLSLRSISFHMYMAMLSARSSMLAGELGQA